MFAKLVCFYEAKNLHFPFIILTEFNLAFVCVWFLTETKWNSGQTVFGKVLNSILPCEMCFVVGAESQHFCDTCFILHFQLNCSHNGLEVYTIYTLKLLPNTFSYSSCKSRMILICKLTKKIKGPLISLVILNNDK